MLQQALQIADEDKQASLERLLTLLRIPSISTDIAYKPECIKTADLLVQMLDEIGFKAERIDSQGMPFVFAERIEGENLPTILLYGHYDVQPVDPLEEWVSDPFSPELLQNDKGETIIRARGAADDKGQLMTFVEATRHIIKSDGKLPVNIRILIEGEEESGSDSLEDFLQDYGHKLKADVAFVCDTNMWNASTPAIITQLRGLVSMEIVIEAADRDLHSGYYGGAARNPLHVMGDIIAALHDENGRVQVEGFYDDVQEPSQEQLAQWNALNMTAEAFLNPIGLNDAAGEHDRSLLEQIWSRPTCDINGVSGGYAGEGFKTVIAGKAKMKLSCRLVPQQDHIKIAQAVKDFVSHYIPKDCKVSFKHFGDSSGIAMDVNSPHLQSVMGALKEEWGQETVLAGCGGSIPIVGDFKHHLGLDSLLVGFGLDDDCIHSPNEKYNLSSFEKGIRSWIRIFYAL